MSFFENVPFPSFYGKEIVDVTRQMKHPLLQSVSPPTYVPTI